MSSSDFAITPSTYSVSCLNTAPRINQHKGCSTTPSSSNSDKSPSSILTETNYIKSIGTNYDTEEAKSVVQTSDGGILLAGFKGLNSCLIKLNAEGEVDRAWEMDAPYADECNSLAQTSDGGSIITGTYPAIVGAGSDLYLAKLNSTGNLEWLKVINYFYLDIGQSVIQANDGCFIVAGGSPEPPEYPGNVIFKFAPSGVLSWAKYIGGTPSELKITSLAKTADSGFIASGTYGGGAATRRIALVKFNASGESEWLKIVDETLGSCQSNSVAQTSDDGYIVTGIDGYGDIPLIKLSSDGSIEWSKTIDGDGICEASSVIQTSDGGYAITGYIGSGSAEGTQFLLAKFTTLGELEWAQAIEESRGYSVIQTPENGYIATGFTSLPSFSNNMLLANFDSSGDIDDCDHISSPILSIGSPTLATDSAYYYIDACVPSITDVTPSVNTITPIITTICEGTYIEEPVGNIPSAISLIQNTPNPFNSRTEITYTLLSNAIVSLDIFDIYGHKIAALAEGQRPAGTYRTFWEADKNTPSGIYFCSLSAGKQIQTIRMTLLK